MIQNMLQNNIWAIVPIRRFAGAKSRLSDVLNPHERATLAKAMAADVLEQLACTRGLAGTLVVTSDLDAHALAADFGARVVAEPTEAGLNAAISQGIRTVGKFRNNPAIMAVPADLPFVTAAELSEAVSALKTHAVVITEAVRDAGTNILGLSPWNVMDPAFGTDSFARHLSLARSAGLEPLVLPLRGAGHDVDVPSDLVMGASLRCGLRTLACLASFRHFAPKRQFELVI
ncbi:MULTISPECIES: 2-phospho-L-lactate guanylyltransferase [unclassified Hyphomicrobium]|uniref:2-phospho-L-lactate guanylyltransferase n=1 Tax=unclassified Hyphomicrobium TaxID=2619925 RepID=UPI000213F4A4|nr:MULTISPECIES: 2-phospho-L-lactate guanylyltransferase [unclassified Hyphomicrobium]CCB66758.1 2-phospho-L-lactate guanylyltransferase CofC [Hyphomicrobium sp. MC1]